jgi:cytochrome c peroxidase
MKIGSLATLVALVGSAGWIGACSTDTSPPPSPEAGATGGTSTGGKATGGGGSGGKAGGSGGVSPTGGSGAGGTSGGSGGSGDLDSGTHDASAGGAAPDASAPDGAVSTPDAGPDAACDNGRCLSKPYPPVKYPPENPGPASPTDDVFKAKEMLGKFLFFEEQVGSLDNQACGTCHRANAGGSDPRTFMEDPTVPPRQGESTAHSVIAHLPGPDGILDANPSSTSDDIRGAAGVLACTTPSNVTGTARQVTTRKPPSYFDAMFAARIFWDGRAGDCKAGDGNGNVGGCFYDPDTLVLNANAKPTIVGTVDSTTGQTLTIGGALEQQSVGPPANSTEMTCADRAGLPGWAKLEAKLSNLALTPGSKAKVLPDDMKAFVATYSTYPKMFAKAFGSTAKVAGQNQPDDVVNSQRFAFAIATHERRLVSNQTPWDKWIEGDDNAMTPGQIRGFNAFMTVGRCQFCHTPPLFTDNAFHYIGFHKPQSDAGRKGITNVATDVAKFKTPTLRNVGLREPFGLLHEGEGPGHNLDIVMTLYKQGGLRQDQEIVNAGIDPALLELPTLTSQDIADILDFLRNALTDPRVKNEQPPFDRPKLSTEP